MEPAITESCDSFLGEFTDDGRNSTPDQQLVVIGSPKPDRAPRPHPYPFIPPTSRDSRTARAFWVRVLERFTEPLGSTGGRRRVTDESKAAPGIAVVECASRSAAGENPPETGPAWHRLQRRGEEVDLGDQAYLVLYSRTTGRAGKTTETAAAIPWTEIVSLVFKVEQPTRQRAAQRKRPKAG
jgi:hypothetical protein